MNRETRKLITVFRDFHFLMAVNCALDPPLRPLSYLSLLFPRCECFQKIKHFPEDMQLQAGISNIIIFFGIV